MTLPMRSKVYGEDVTIHQVDTSDHGWVWVQTESHGAIRWERLTRSEWVGVALDAEL